MFEANVNQIIQLNWIVIFQVLLKLNDVIVNSIESCEHSCSISSSREYYTFIQ